MPKILNSIILLFCLFIPFLILGQLNIPTNSFETAYKEKYPTLSYRYDVEMQVHNYSNNWDFDGDGTKDEVYFKGDGGAHLYYYLIVAMSKDKKVRSFPYLRTDFPSLNFENDSIISDFSQQELKIGFKIYDYNKDGVLDLLIYLDSTSFSIQHKRLERKGVYTSSIVVSFNKGKIKMKDVSRFEGD